MKRKKIVLATMPVEGEFVNWTTPNFFTLTNVNKYIPLGILSLATNLPPRHEVIILDASSEPWTINETIEKIEEQEPDILGLSVPTRRTYAMNKILEKTTAPYKVVGGPHVTHYSELTLRSGADAVFVGPLADTEFREAVENMPKGIINCETKINDIEFPDRELLEVERYFPKAHVLFKAENRLPMFSSIGCPNKCTFCNVQSKRVQYKDSQTIVDEMQYLDTLGSRSVHILDDNFNVNRNHLVGIINEMESRGLAIEWSGRGQTKMDYSLAHRLRDTGFKRIHVGIEALDDEILRYFRKNETVEDVHRFCQSMNNNNIDILGYFILGSPVETEEYRRTLASKIEELGVKHPFLNILFPEPNTKYYKSLISEGYYKKDIWVDFMQNPTPYFEIPYPYGETKKQELIAYTDELTEHFKLKNKS